MEILNKIELLLKENKQTKANLCKYLGLGKATFSHWKSGENTSYLKKLPEIATYFDVSIDFLLGKTDVRKQDIKNPPQFSASRLQSFEGSDPEVKQIELAKLDHIDELLSAAGKLSIEQINLLTSMAKNMKDKD